VGASTTGTVDAKPLAEADKPYERIYSLGTARGEALALLLRLDLPFDTSVTTREYAPRSPGIEVIVSAPKRVHDVVGPLVGLLVADAAAKDQAEARKIFRETEEAALREAGLTPEQIEQIRKKREATP
ncbi:MAG TPA: hypothetical protein VG125_25635, partial [Pirellulales bacterium]|nr:hypothetical protein [Pirellulales bacterium]